MVWDRLAAMQERLDVTETLNQKAKAVEERVRANMHEVRTELRMEREQGKEASEEGQGAARTSKACDLEQSEALGEATRMWRLQATSKRKAAEADPGLQREEKAKIQRQDW